ncbi:MULTISPECIES: pyridoxamine 5'-phosphate oxidase family protein [unclassified Mycobacterium]|uniref:pyridoxamine 5'-phosphate oxidase family protein n=1 Tax=unclassified Mycobacterium TaxID=2642494 RepID=UPI000800AD25|nr:MULTISPECIES: pyridoxamine 5'-phosphate oxidase family protein [unclassified Mycobacterium]OBG77543.1 pyridoxamine 5-phosphate oxidase [Mycobacterium sp. E1214]OBH21985.1 pyridoxamine 5-phosphate oxidase [Mycobacterium sp. E1319]
MSKHYATIAFTEDVRAIQRDHGSQAFYDRKRIAGKASPGRDPLTATEQDYLAQRDSFYLATISSTGWPYVQFRGGPMGFLRVLDEHTLAWADVRGNLQYISTGNLAAQDRVAIIAVDYVHRRRLKIFGHARVVTAQDDPQLASSLMAPDYEAAVERAVVIDVEASDWNCPQHITPRYSAADLEPALAALRDQLAALQAENASIRSTSGISQ